MRVDGIFLSGSTEPRFPSPSNAQAGYSYNAADKWKRDWVGAPICHISTSKVRPLINNEVVNVANRTGQRCIPRIF